MSRGCLAAFLIASSTLCAFAEAGVTRLLGAYMTVRPNQLVELDRTTAAATVIGPIQILTNMNGLAYDSRMDVLYGVVPSVPTSNLYHVNRSTGQTTLIGSLGGAFRNVNGLAFDPVDRILYASDNQTNSLLTLNLTTGIATNATSIVGTSEVEGLGYDPINRVLYGISGVTQRVVRIDPATGIAISLPTVLAVRAWRGLEFDVEQGVLWATDVSNLYRVNPVTGRPTLIGGIPNVQGLAIVPGPSTLTALAAGIACLIRRRRPA